LTRYTPRHCDCGYTGTCQDVTRVVIGRCRPSSCIAFRTDRCAGTVGGLLPGFAVASSWWLTPDRRGAAADQHTDCFIHRRYGSSHRGAPGQPTRCAEVSPVRRHWRPAVARRPEAAGEPPARDAADVFSRAGWAESGCTGSQYLWEPSQSSGYTYVSFLWPTFLCLLP